MLPQTTLVKCLVLVVAVCGVAFHVASATPTSAVEARNNDCFGLRITYPHKGTVWHPREKHNVKWEMKKKDWHGDKDHNDKDYDEKNYGKKDHDGKDHDGKDHDGKDYDGKDHDDKDYDDKDHERDDDDDHDNKQHNGRWNNDKDHDDKDHGDKNHDGKDYNDKDHGDKDHDDWYRQKGTVYLRKKDGRSFTLADHVEVKAGRVEIKVPDVETGNDYQVVLSVNGKADTFSEYFSIVKKKW